MRYILLLIVAVSLLSCDATKKSRKTTYHKSTKHRKTRTAHNKHKVKKPNWRIKQDKPPVKEDMPYDYGYNLTSEKKDAYDIALLMPMRAHRVNEAEPDKIPKSTLRFIEFWAGAKLALTDLNQKGIHLNVTAKDTKYSSADAKRIWRSLRNDPPDVIVGPYKRENVQYYAERAKDYGFTFVSPWISSPKITKNNPFYIQTKAGLRAHYETIFHHISKHYDADQVYIVIKEKDAAKRKLMEELYAEQSEEGEAVLPHFIEVNVDTVLRGHEMIDSSSLDWEAHSPMVFFLPYASNKDKMFVYSFMQKFELLTGTNDAVLYGLYKWLDFGEDVYDLINRMDVRVSVSGLVNPFNSATRQFRRRYFNIYGSLPGKDAYEGYDLFYYLGESLDKYGDKFQLHINTQKPVSRIHTVYDLQPVMSKTENRVEYFENIFVDLIEMKHYNFKRVGLR